MSSTTNPFYNLSASDIQTIKTNIPGVRDLWAKDANLNPLRKNPRFGHGTTAMLTFSGFVSDEDVLFAPVGKGGDAICMTQEEDDGTIRVVLPLGTPPDQVAKFHSQARVAERRTKMKAHLKKKLAEKTNPKSKSKSCETHEEMMVRYKAMCDLLGEEEASKMMDRDFWMD
jgi:hypothetical protein